MCNKSAGRLVRWHKPSVLGIKLQTCLIYIHTVFFPSEFTESSECGCKHLSKKKTKTFHHTLKIMDDHKQQRTAQSIILKCHIFRWPAAPKLLFLFVKSYFMCKCVFALPGISPAFWNKLKFSCVSQRKRFTVTNPRPLQGLFSDLMTMLWAKFCSQI